jgi:hypothetical protein
MSVANIVAPLLSGALIGHRFYIAWALSMAGIATCGAVMAAGLLVSRHAETV